MSDFDFTPRSFPTFYFIGMSTARSSIMRVFPAWVRHLGLRDSVITGVDCKWHDEPEVYRRIVSFIKEDELSLGGLITSHKIDLFTAAEDLFDELGPYATLLSEVSCISKRGRRLIGHAKDPITSGLALEAFQPSGQWKGGRAELCVLGAGGSSLALTTHLMQKKNQEDRPAKVYVTNRSPQRLERMRNIHRMMDSGLSVEYVLAPDPKRNDEVVNALKPGSFVVNATGLGKDAPGSPLSDAARFPHGGSVWDFNYRGDLLFLEQAERQKRERQLHLEDGWVYFLHGWTRHMSEVFHIDIPTGGQVFEELSRIATENRS